MLLRPPDSNSHKTENAETLGPIEGLSKDKEVTGEARDDPFWGPRLGYLLAERTLDHDESNNYQPWNSIGGEAGSWVDPLFLGPALVGDLPPLGARYQDLGLLGEGATAKVYQAMDTLLMRRVAIKILKQPEGPALSEARAQARVEHPNVCRVYEVGKGYIVMELVEGETLAQAAQGMALARKVEIIRDVALGVHEAHICGLMHLDLKLNNILMKRGGDGSDQPMVTDFGTMRFGAPALIGPCPIGTPPYTSPEQLAGDLTRVDPRSDVYSMGVMLYVLASGSYPFAGRDLPAMLTAMALEPPRPLHQMKGSVPKDLCQIVHLCLMKDPKNRYGSALELANDLDRFLHDQPVVAAGHAWSYLFAKAIRRNRNLSWVVALGLTSLLVLGGVMLRRNLFLSEESEWDHHFQQTVASIRTRIDHAYRLPPHNIEPELELTRVAVEALKGEVGRVGRAGRGPGFLALGQCALLLDGNDAQALAEFQRAWDVGYRPESTRAWLSLAMLDKARRVSPIFDRTQNETTRRKARAEVRLHYLQKAKAMLEGRGGPEQAHLRHLVALVEARAQEQQDPDALLTIAQSYRRQVPDDLDGMIEEATALTNKAHALWLTANRTHKCWPPQCSAAVTPLRHASIRILAQALKAAPSYPMIYLQLAQECLEEVRFPTEDSRGQELLLSKADAWFREGLQISRNDPALIGKYAEFLGREQLGWRLQQGLGPGPALEALQKLMAQARASSNWSAIASCVDGLSYYMATLNEFGITSQPVVSTALEEILQRPGEGAGWISFLSQLKGWSLLEARHRLETGDDPGPVLLARGKAIPWQQIGPDPWWRYTADLLIAEHAVLNGINPAQALGEAEAAVKEVAVEGDLNAFLRLKILLLKAQFDPGAFNVATLEAALASLQQSRPIYSPTAIDANFFLIRTRFARGEDGAELFHSVMTTMENWSKSINLFGSAMQGAHLAELRLLEAHLAKSPIPVLDEGLRVVNKALTFNDPSRNHQQHFYLILIDSPYPVHTLKIKGDLLVARATCSQTRGECRAWARQAVAAYRKVLLLDPNLALSVAPDLARARALGG